jgi:DNA-binding NtrC family response regulator
VQLSGTGCEVEDRLIRVLFVTGNRHDHESLSALLAGTAWGLSHAWNCAEVMRAVQRGSFPIIVLGSDVPEEDWANILEFANQQIPPSKIIAVSGFSQEVRWQGLLDRGAYDILARPYQAGETFQVMGFAWLQWRHERECRRLEGTAARLERKPAWSAKAAAKSA